MVDEFNVIENQPFTRRFTGTHNAFLVRENTQHVKDLLAEKSFKASEAEVEHIEQQALAHAIQRP